MMAASDSYAEPDPVALVATGLLRHSPVAAAAVVNTSLQILHRAGHWPPAPPCAGHPDQYDTILQGLDDHLHQPLGEALREARHRGQVVSFTATDSQGMTIQGLVEPLPQANGEHWFYLQLQFPVAADASGRTADNDPSSFASFAELRAIAERFQTLADNIAQFAWMAEPDGHIFWFNRRWFEYTGTTLKDVQGWGWQQVHHPDHLQRVVDRISQCFRNGEEWEDTFPLRSKDGHYRWFLSRAVPIRDREGRVQRWFGTNTDITAEREAEQSLQAADQRKDHFLANLAHELRNPLSPLVNGLELLNLNVADRPESDQRVLAMMGRQLGQLIRLVDDILDISRITLDRLTLQRQTVWINEILESAQDAVRPLLEGRHQQLLLSLPEEDVFLDADSHRLTQVFTALLHNAAKFSPEGSRLRIDVDADISSVRVAVTDGGPGIAPQFQQRIFELFFQTEDDKGSPHGQGLGIGLSLVKTLVEMHAGTIEVQNHPTCPGSIFTVSLPRAWPAKTPLSEEETNVHRPTSLRILVVDDNRDATESVTKLLLAWGHRVQRCYDGGAALVVAAGFNPDVVLLDLGLPVMDGYQVARQLRQKTSNPALRIIAVTGWGQKEYRQRSREAGIDIHLVKPLDLEKLRTYLFGESSG